MDNNKEIKVNRKIANGDINDKKVERIMEYSQKLNNRIKKYNMTDSDACSDTCVKGFVYDFKFTAKPFQYSTSADMIGWTIVLLPKAISIDIRENFKWLEEGWGRMKVNVKVGASEWRTSIWFDTKHDTYLLPLNAKIRKKENICFRHIGGVAMVNIIALTMPIIIGINAI